MTAPTQHASQVRDLAHRHPGTLLLGAVAAGAVAGWVTRGAKDGHGGQHTTGYDEPRGRANVPGTPPTQVDVTRAVEQQDAGADATPAPVPGDIRGGNVADQGFNSGPTKRGAM